MRRNPKQYVCLNALAAFLFCGAAECRTPAKQAEADVLVYFHDDVSVPVAALARKTTTTILAAIGIGVVWIAEGERAGAAKEVGLRLRVAETAQPGVRRAAMAYAYPFAGGTKE